MKNFFEKITEYGFERQKVMERFVNDDEFYVECFSQVLSDAAFDDLGKFLEMGDKQEAFDCAHSLKGLLSNIGLMVLYDKISCIVEILRGTKEGDISTYYKELLDLRKACLELL